MIDDSEITIESSTEEVNAWVRKGYALWRNKKFYYQFSWTEGEGYDIIKVQPVDSPYEWSVEEIEQFEKFHEYHDDFGQLLDDLTYEIA